MKNINKTKNFNMNKKIIQKFGSELKLDIGCGKNKKTGFIGVDIDKNSDVDIVASALNLPFEDSTVSEVNSSHLVEHLYPNEVPKFFNEIYRVLKKGGVAKIKIDRDWSERKLLKKDPEHKKRYSVEEIKEMVKKFRFSKVKRRIYRYGWHIRQKIFVELKKSPMKIGIITSSLSETNGWGRYSLEIVKELKNFGEVKVISHQIEELKEIETYPILPPPLGNSLKKIWALLKIIKYLKGCDIFHCLIEPYAPIIALANLSLKKPFVITAHGTYAIQPINKKGINSFLMKFAYKKANKIICVSNFTKNEILKKCNLNNLEVIPNGVDYSAFSNYEPNKARPNRTIILSVGPIKSRKGYDASIKAISRLKKENLKYYIIGDIIPNDFFYKQLKELIKKENLEEKVKFLGRVSNEELLNLYNKCNIFLLTPKNVNCKVEGFGLVYLEANACGKPVIGTYNCGAEEAIINGYNGFLVPQNDPEKTAKAIKYLLNNPEVARKMGENGRKRAQDLSWENIVKEIIKIYEQSL